MSNFTATQGGKGWYNPMTITLTAAKGTGDITDYYVAFYNKTLTQAATDSTFLSTVEGYLNSDAKNGFLLRYTSSGTGTYYVWDPQQSSANKWVDITNNTRGYNICSVACSAQTILYTVASISAASWKVALDKNFGSKTMYTATYVVDSNSLSAFNANINPTYP